jgi:peptidyl-prolyl cis-trans isomerase SurA
MAYAGRMRWRWFLPVLSLALGSAPPKTAAASPKTVGLIDRVIAVVGYEPVLLSELRARAKPYLVQLKAGPARVAAEAQLLRELLNRMIDELLIAAEADRSKLPVTPSEIDAAIQTVATDQGLAVPELLKAAHGGGMSEKEYRAEIRRQLLEGKILQIRVLPRIKDLSSLAEPARSQRIAVERNKWIQEQRAARFIEVRL